MRFRDPINVRIANQLTRQPYFLVRACDLEVGTLNIKRIASICNEPDVYEWLFHEPLSGKPYPEKKAWQWLEWARAGWAADSHYVFAVMSEAGEIAAACDIKSNDDVAEIGYWASSSHRGTMTNAVMAMCICAAKAGFSELYAHTRAGNSRSEAVLRRIGFDRVPSTRSDNLSRWELSLKELNNINVVPNQSPDPTLSSVTPPAGQESRPR